MAGVFMLAAVFAELKAQQTSSIEDPFDGQIYPVVKIGNQYWLGKNLNSAISGTVYENDINNRHTYGFLYTWKQAKDYGILAGWRLPSKGDWEALENYISNDGHSGDIEAALKSTSGWDDNNNGTDNYGFNALPAGGFYKEFWEEYYWKGQETRWWCSTSSGAPFADVYQISIPNHGHRFHFVQATDDYDLCSIRLVTDKQEVINSVLSCDDWIGGPDEQVKSYPEDEWGGLKDCLGFRGYIIPDSVFQDLVNQGATPRQIATDAIPQYHSFLQE